MSWWNSIKSFFGYETVTVRAKDENGRFKADDKSTPDVNEAYETKVVKKKAPAKKKAAPKKAPAKRGRPKKAK